MFSVYHQKAEVSIAQIQAHRRQAPAVIENRDAFTQIVHTLQSPPDPNIPQNLIRLHDMCPADNQGAEVSIAQTLRQAPVLLESRDTFTQIVQASPPPPAPNIPKNPDRLHDMFPADNQEA